MKQTKFFVLLSTLIAGAAFAAPAPVREAGNNLEERIARLERMLEARNQAQLEMQQQLDAVENDVNSLRGEVEVHGHKLEQILARQRDLYQELERRLSQPAVADSVSGAAQSAVAAVAAPATEQGESERYQTAINLVLKERKNEQGAKALTEFLQKYPQSSYAPNAHFWIGQLKYIKNDFDGAEKSFLTVVNDYAKSAKRSEALLKLGLIADNKNNSAKAANLYKQVIREYPSSSAARLAKTKLK